tara:strand:- start:103 stop:717 length:615 start_codon:yes stop_codon:yes gene_type:complete
MSTLKTTNITHESNSGTANVVLDSSGNATVNGNLTVTGTAQNKVIGSHSASGGQSIGTGTTYEYTPGIPDSAKIIYLTFANISATGTDKIRMQLGTASAWTTSGYSNMIGYAATGNTASVEEQTTYMGIPHSGWGAATNDFSGYFQFVNHVDNKWMYSGHITEPDEVYLNWNHGFIDVDIKRFKFYLSGSNSFSGGIVNCHWIS